MNVLRWIPAAVVVMAGGLLMTGVPAVAHHSSAPFYDATRTVEVQGVITKFVFRNPHSFIYLDATDEQGQKIEREIEMGAATNMAQRGWTPATLKPGDVIKVVGQPSRAPGTYGICCAKISRPDGSPIGPPPGAQPGYGPSAAGSQ